MNPGELGHFGVFRFAFGMCVNALWKEHGGQPLIDFKVICLLLSFSTITLCGDLLLTVAKQMLCLNTNGL